MQSLERASSADSIGDGRAVPTRKNRPYPSSYYGQAHEAISSAVMAEVKGLPFNAQRAAALAFTPTRLKAMDDKWQESLINLGYIISAAALGSYALGPHGAARLAWPYAGGLG